MRQIHFLSIIVFLLLTASCTVTTVVTIENDASGRADVVIELHPVAATYMNDIATGFGGPDTPGPFDVEAIRRSLLARDGVELQSIEADGADTLRLSLRFDDVAGLLEPAAGPGQPRAADQLSGIPVLSFAEKGGERSLSLTLTRENFHRVSGLFIPPESPLTVLLPYAETDFMPREEYLEVLTYALEDYLGEVSIHEFVEGRGVYATVRADGPVLRAPGGTVTGGAAKFFIPLVDALTLEDDIEYSVTW